MGQACASNETIDEILIKRIIKYKIEIKQLLLNNNDHIAITVYECNVSGICLYDVIKLNNIILFYLGTIYWSINI